MTLLKKNIFIPICLAAVIIGYTAAEWLAPKYFHPPPEVEITPTNIISYIGVKPAYIRPTISGNYLVGQFAQNQKDWETASKYIGEIIYNKNTHVTDELKSHSMVLEMSAGNPDKAIKKSYEIVSENEGNNVLATLFVALDHFKNERYNIIPETLSDIEKDSMAAFIVPVLNLWAKSDTSEIDTSLLPRTNIYVYHALLAGLYKNEKESVRPYVMDSFKIGELDVRDAEKFADLFYLYGEADSAKAIYQELQKQNFSNDTIDKKLEKLKNNQPIKDNFRFKTINNPADGAAIVFLNMAEILEREYSDDSANVFAQMALTIKPELVEAREIISRIFARAERYEDAIETLQSIPKTTSNHEDIQKKIANLYVKKDNDEKAISILKNINGNEQDIDALTQIGDIYRYNEDFEKASQTYSKIINQFKELPAKYWHVLYARGMSFERLGKFEKAEKDLKQALVFRPDEPYLLNYLGYSWADQGINLEQSLDLIDRAFKLRPDDGYIADSLGWVYYKLERYEEAVEYLEKAVALLPYDTTVNDHLGDAYWRVGREKEARFQWERALNNQENEDLTLTASLEKKIRHGLKESDKELSEIPVKSVPEIERSAKKSNQDI